ncbi:MAG: glutamate synthase-related protein, partial [Acidipropionibacterium jensenii]|nr:glutamate synthase-related protein [Acidipropionibacterium jensenii]
ATTALVVEGCIMMRKCHSDTCPVGIATQNPELRKKFAGNPDHVVTFFMFMARQVRELLAELGFRSVEEAVGHVEVLKARTGITHWKARGLDLSPVLAQVEVPYGQTLHHRINQDHDLEDSLDVTLIDLAAPALENGEQVHARLAIRNVDRTVGTMLGNRVTRATNGKGLPEGTIAFTFDGTAGQSFGAFLPAGVTLKLVGDANDYVAKGLSGGRIIVTPPEDVVFRPEEQIIAGNVIGYGATSGQIFLRGLVGERFCVRNSGATAVVEGVGDHGCEYMTGGEALVLGPTGRNFAAGMSGGVAWVLHLDPTRLNPEMVDGMPLEDSDLVRIRELLTAHLEATGSTVAAGLLDADDETLSKDFTKVVPRDYARILRVVDEAKTQHLDEHDTTELLMEASHG